MPAGSITQDQVDFVETWENVSPTTNYIIRLDVRGDETHVQVSGQRKFMLSSQERMLTESRILDPRDNPFQNGCFRPIITPDELTIESNPNALSDEDILAIFKSSDAAWGEWVETIDSPATLQRMMDLADSVEEISLKRFRELEMRLNSITGGPKHATQKDEETYRKMGGDGPPSGKGRKAMTGGSSSTS